MEETGPYMAVSTIGGWKYRFIDFLITFAGVFLAIEISKVI